MKRFLSFLWLLTAAVMLTLTMPAAASAASIDSGEITGSGVALREGPSRSDDVILRMDKGDIVEILKTNVNAEWHKVRFDGETGYVNRVYVDFDRSMFDVSYTGTVVNVDEYVNVRRRATTGSSIIGRADRGESYKVTAANVTGGWHKVSYEGETGYISSKYLSLSAKVDDDQLQSLSVSGGSMAPKFTPDETGYMVTTSSDEVTIKVKANDGVRVAMNDHVGKSLTVEVPNGGMKTVRIQLDGKTQYTVYIMRDVVTVGTWNIKRGSSRLLEQGRLVRDQLPDIMGIQEAYRNLSSGSIVDNLASLKTKHMTITRFCKTLDQSGGGEYGHGVITHYDVISHEKFELPSPGVEQRYVSKTVMDVDGKTVSFYNTHLSYNSADIRADQFDRIRQLMEEDDSRYIILVGDFNCKYKEFARLGDGYTVVNTPDTKYYDYRGRSIDINEIDNIIVSDNIRVVNTRMVRTELSDHCPVFAYLEL